jgi:hypothetical protein
LGTFNDTVTVIVPDVGIVSSPGIEKDNAPGPREVSTNDASDTEMSESE